MKYLKRVWFTMLSPFLAMAVFAIFLFHAVVGIWKGEEDSESWDWGFGEFFDD